MSRPLLSLCMIVKDEQDNLPRCLASVSDVVDEMIIVDTGSTDATMDIAKQFQCKVYRVPWDDDFSKARNAAMDKAEGDWILLMDADEELAAEDKYRIKELIQEEADGYFFQVLSYVGDYPGADMVSNLNLKLVRKRHDYRFIGAIHEQLASVIMKVNPQARLKIIDVKVYHYGYLRRNVEKQNKRRRNIAILEKQLSRYPDERFLMFNLGNEYFALGQYEKALKLYKMALADLNPYMGYASKLYIQTILCMEKLGYWHEALNVVDKGLEEFPQLTDLVYLKGGLYHRMGLYSQALRCFKQCADMGEAPLLHAFLVGVGGYRAYYAMGELYEDLKDYEMAYKSYLQALKLKSDFLPPIYRIGHILFLTMLPADALNALKKYFDVSPNSHLIMADILAAEHRYKDALEYIKMAEETVDLSPKFMYLKAQCLMNMQCFEDARRCLEEIPDDDPRYPLALKDMVWCFWMQRAPDDADVAIFFMEEQGLSPAVVKVYRVFSQLLRGDGDMPVLSDDEVLSLEYEEGIFEILDRLLIYKQFDVFERALNMLNLIKSDDVLMRLGKLYYKHGYNALAKTELLRSIKAFGIYDGEALDMLKAMLH